MCGLTHSLAFWLPVVEEGNREGRMRLPVRVNEYPILLGYRVKLHVFPKTLFHLLLDVVGQTVLDESCCHEVRVGWQVCRHGLLNSKIRWMIQSFMMSALPVLRRPKTKNVAPVIASTTPIASPIAVATTGNPTLAVFR